MVNPISALSNIRSITPIFHQIDKETKLRYDFLYFAEDEKSGMAKIKEVPLLTDEALNKIFIDKNKFVTRLLAKADLYREAENPNANILNRTISNKKGAKSIDIWDVINFKDNLGRGFGDNHWQKTSIVTTAYWCTLNIKGKTVRFINDEFEKIDADKYENLLIDAMDVDGDRRISWPEYRDYNIANS